MGRYKADNPKDQRITLLLDRKLRNQLLRTAKSKNATIASIARRAIRLFISEENNK